MRLDSQLEDDRFKMSKVKLNVKTGFEAENPAPDVRSIENTVYDESSMQTPTIGKLQSAIIDTGSQENEDEDIYGQGDAPSIARQALNSHRTRTPNNRSSNLHELASCHVPDNSTTLVVGEANGSYFEAVHLATPVFEHFSVADEASSSTSQIEKKRAKVRSADGSRWLEKASSKRALSNERRSKSTQDRPGSRRTRSATNMSTASSDEDNLPSSFQTFSKDRITTTTPPQEPHEIKDDGSSHDKKRYSPRASVSSSCSSNAESAGTAADATDSEYEERRSASRDASTSGSRSASYTERPIQSIRRLSSFAPIPPMGSLSLNGSATYLAALPVDGSVSPSEVSPRASAETAHPPLDTHSRSNSDDKGKEKMHDDNALPSSLPVSKSKSAHSHSSEESTTSSGMSNLAEMSKPPIGVKRLQNTNGMSGLEPVRSQPNIIPVMPLSEVTSFSQLKSRKNKPSALEKVLSKTRQKDLPPKPEEEDVSFGIWIDDIAYTTFVTND